MEEWPGQKCGDFSVYGHSGRVVKQNTSSFLRGSVGFPWAN